MCGGATRDNALPGRFFENDTVCAIGIERRVKVDQVDAFIFNRRSACRIRVKDVQIITVVKLPAQRAGLLEQPWIVTPFSLPLVISNVPLDHPRCYLIPHCPCKVAIFPKLPAPQLLPQLRVFLEQDTGGDTLQNPYYLCNRILRWEGEEEVDMIRSDLHLLNLKAKILGSLVKELFHPRSNLVPHPLAIFGSPN
jgi:hypothetical protein